MLFLLLLSSDLRKKLNLAGDLVGGFAVSALLALLAFSDLAILSDEALMATIRNGDGFDGLLTYHELPGDPNC